VIAATSVNPGLLRSERAAYRKSCDHDIGGSSGRV
jgi:hypothetical protein